MSLYKQMKLGPELMSPARESWLGYYVFAGLTLVVLAGGGVWLGRSELEAGDLLIAALGVLILALICLAVCIVCHLFGHLFDKLAELTGDDDVPVRME